MEDSEENSFRIVLVGLVLVTNLNVPPFPRPLVFSVTYLPDWLTRTAYYS